MMDQYLSHASGTNNIAYPCCGVGVGSDYQLFINNFKQGLTNGN